MKFLSPVLILFFFLFISCNKDDDSSAEEQVSEPNFYALSVGNSWRYEYFKRIDRTDEFESLNAFDDVTISGTSEINGNTYYTFETTTSGNDNTSILVPDNGTVVTKLRDSLGYLIDEHSVKHFSYVNINQEYLIRDVAGDAKIYGLLSDVDSNLQVAAGNFDCFVNDLYARLPNGNTFPGRDFIFYSEGIGKIKSTISWVSDSLTSAEIRLVSYSIPN